MQTRIKDRIADAIKQSGKTKVQVARDVGVAVTQLYAWLEGKSVPRIERVVKLADSCGVTVDYLARDEDEQEDIVIYDEREDMQL